MIDDDRVDRRVSVPSEPLAFSDLLTRAV